MKACPAQKKNIHMIQARTWLRVECLCGFTVGNGWTETQMVPELISTGPSVLDRASAEPEKVLASRLLSIGLVQAPMGQNSDRKSKEP